MGTVIRATITKNNPYYISKHRYYELKHFCLQYKEFKKIYNDMCSQIHTGTVHVSNDNSFKDDKSLFVRQRYLDMMTLIEDSAKLTDPIFSNYIFIGVTEGYPYSYFKTTMNIPCGKDMYYELYRKFFYILSKKKDFV